jgi:hypothetical protein
MEPASVTAINKVDADSLMAELCCCRGRALHRGGGGDKRVAGGDSELDDTGGEARGSFERETSDMDADIPHQASVRDSG